MTAPLGYEQLEPAESLADALRHIAAERGLQRPYAELVAVLGLGAAVVAKSDEPLELWPTYARDARLVQAAGLYGLHPRPLHPPEATRGLSRSAEFALHFQDSYAPLILEALAHDQPVLAWRGWPAPSSRCWGMVTEERDGRLWGHVTTPGGELTPLIDPAHQIYIVEAQRPRLDESPEVSALFPHVARLFREMWRGDWAAGPGVVAGARAYEHWMDCLRNRDKQHSPLHEQHSRVVRVLIAAREQLSQFLDGVRGEHVETANRWKQACQRITTIMHPFNFPGDVQSCLDKPGGVEPLTRALEQARNIDAEIAELLGDG